MTATKSIEAEQEQDEEDASNQGSSKSMWVDLGRAFAGALIFSISLLMTMETWSMGFYMNRWRLVLFVGVSMLLLVGLARYHGFRKNSTWHASIVDAFVGYAVGVVTGSLFLSLFGMITWEMPVDEIIGKVALQSISSSIGALLAREQLGGSEEKPKEEGSRSQSYGAEIFLMIIGALFVAYTVAPTEEILLIAYRMTPWHALVAVLVSLTIMHTFVYWVDFHGQEEAPEGHNPWLLFIHFTLVGYLAVFLTSFYILWTFGRIENTALSMTLMCVVVLSIPGALGAAAARLLL
jgi:putative integral membrane protein (TIGR02587 family)